MITMVSPLCGYYICMCIMRIRNKPKCIRLVKVHYVVIVNSAANGGYVNCGYRIRQMADMMARQLTDILRQQHMRSRFQIDLL